MSSGNSGGGGPGRFLGGIGVTVLIIVVLNVLSYVFHWGWIFY